MHGKTEGTLGGLCASDLSRDRIIVLTTAMAAVMYCVLVFVSFRVCLAMSKLCCLYWVWRVLPGKLLPELHVLLERLLYVGLPVG